MISVGFICVYLESELLFFNFMVIIKFYVKFCFYVLIKIVCFFKCRFVEINSVCWFVFIYLYLKGGEEIK